MPTSTDLRSLPLGCFIFVLETASLYLNDKRSIHRIEVELERRGGRGECPERVVSGISWIDLGSRVPVWHGRNAELEPLSVVVLQCALGRASAF